MKSSTKLNIRLHVEGYASDIFNDLHKPELNDQYESFLGTNSPLFEDEPEWRMGEIVIDSMPTLIKTIMALMRADNTELRKRKLCLYISGENEEKSMHYTAWIGDGKPSYETGGEIRIDESVLTDEIRKAATLANKILSKALKSKLIEDK